MPMRISTIPMDFWESLKEWLKARKVMLIHWAYVKNLLMPTPAWRVSRSSSFKIKNPNRKLAAGVRKIISTTLPQK